MGANYATEGINNGVALLSRAAVPRLFSVGGYRLRVKLNVSGRKMVRREPINFFVNPVDLALKNCNAAQDKVSVFYSVRIS